MKKKILTAVLTATMLLSLFTACNGAEAEVVTETEVTTTAATEAAYTVVPPEPTGNNTIPEVNIEMRDIPQNDGTEFVSNINVGWNLGNTLDASSDTNSQSDELTYESMWNGSITTQQMIDTLQAAGFNAIRVPVSWHNHVDDDFTISEVWLNRVQEVVDYAYNRGMYVILNIHHDIYEEYYFPTLDCLETSKKYTTAIWQQLAARFADYDEKLIFESINEPRLRGTDVEWYVSMSNAACAEAVDCINQTNQVFVDVVRAAGGNNATRFLMVPGYCASPDGVLIDEFILPTDIEGNSNKIIISVHAYTPYNFALQAPTDAASIDTFAYDSERSTNEIDSFMDKLYEKYISQGTPVIIGEFGARNKGENTQARVDYAAYYVAAARARGIACFWWDNAAFLGSGENFGLMNRTTCFWQYPDIAIALTQ